MNKVCIELIVPVMEAKYDVFIPVNKKIIDIIFLLNKAINELNDGYYPLSNKLSLIDASSGTIYDVNLTVKECKILNGAKIILV
ncbi:MAG TPA: hypothetical protein PK737_02100 [Bacilli bacterium]|mgnify:CR=1 FL=1|nr:hypothetical protein [Bacilli bacterium]